jgi:hypothetical protein
MTAKSGTPSPARQNAHAKRGRISRGDLGAGQVFKTLDNDEAGDLALEEGVQELGIVPEDHASVRLAARTVHVGMGKHAGATVHPAAVDGSEADGANPVEQSLAQ